MCQPILTRKSHRSSSHQSPPPPLTNMKKQAKRVDVYTNLRSQLRKASQIPIAAASSTSHRIREEEALRGVRSRHGGGERELERAASEADETGRGGFGGGRCRHSVYFIWRRRRRRGREQQPEMRREEGQGIIGTRPANQEGARGLWWYPFLSPAGFQTTLPVVAMISLRFCGLVNV
jgi:hypothetical protein